MATIMKWKCRAMAGLLIILFASCTKDLGIDQVGTGLKFVNTSPDATSVQFNLNGEKAFTNVLAFTDTTAYLPFAGATYNVSASVGSKVVANTIIDFVPLKNYTLFMVDSASKASVTVVSDVLATADTLSTTHLRFFNFVPNAGALSLAAVYNNKDTVGLLAPTAFNAASNGYSLQKFTAFPSGQYELFLLSGNLIVARLPSAVYLKGKNYTVYSRGFNGGSGSQAASLAILHHK